MVKKKWHKIQRKNSWESLSYWAGKKKIIQGTKLRVRFPDGTTKLRRVRFTVESRSYFDHGTTHVVSTNSLYVRIKLLGLRIKVPLEQLECEL